MPAPDEPQDEPREERHAQSRDEPGTEPQAEPREERRPEPPGGPGAPAVDEDAAWQRIVAAFDQEPAAGAGSWPTAEDLREDEPELPPAPPAGSGLVMPRSFVLRTPRVGPRDYTLADEDDDEGHFVPPEPPPLPEADTTTKFAWVAVLGGPLLMVGFVLFQQPLTWWATVLGVGGFVGGFATLVARMRNGTEDDDDPQAGAVV